MIMNGTQLKFKIVSSASAVLVIMKKLTSYFSRISKRPRLYESSENYDAISDGDQKENTAKGKTVL